MASHVPERGKQSIRYYGAYANSVRGKQRKRQEVEPIPTVLEPVICSKACRRNRARLIQKVYETDPAGTMGLTTITSPAILPPSESSFLSFTSQRRR